MSASGEFTDQQLLSLLTDGDRSAFTEIYQRYWKKMLTISWNHTKDKTTAEDIVHEVFMNLWEKKDTLAILDLPAFLATAVKFSVFKNYQRAAHRTELAKKHYHFEDLTLEEEKWDALFLQEYINGLVEQLPEKCRLVFKLSREAGLKNAAIAAELQISEKGVEANLTRALKLIRGGLENSGLILLIAAEVHKNIY